MPRRQYTKTPASPDQIVEHLLSRGLEIPDNAAAAAEIYRIGYSHLHEYFLSRRLLEEPEKPFLPGTKFKDIIRIYQCDTELRSKCFAAVSMVEILLRSRFAEILAQRSGKSHPYDVSAFVSRQQRQTALISFKRAYSSNSQQNEALRHYRSKYYPKTSFSLPPIWLIKESVSFGTFTRYLFRHKTPVRAILAREFGMQTPELLDTWLPAILDLRNMCAHHDRIFNRKFQKHPEIYRNQKVPSSNHHQNRLRGLLEAIDYMLNAHGSPIGVERDVRHILSRYPEVNPVEVGFESLGWSLEFRRQLRSIW